MAPVPLLIVIPLGLPVQLQVGLFTDAGLYV
jgi:hypothetical protein